MNAALDRALDLRPDLANFKNLETVQGDGRDTIVLSSGYGKSKDDGLPHRFGPLTQDAGYRRPSVAVTRARCPATPSMPTCAALRKARGIRTRAGRPVLAIECDCAAYHSSASARDRDRLRQAHLHRLGWRLVRIWSTHWFHGRELETERVLAAYQEAVRLADLMDAVAPDAAPVPAEPPPHRR